MAAPPRVRARTIGSPQAKFLKGAEENQVERNILVATIAAAHPSTYGTPRTMDKQLGTHKANTVLIISNVIIVVTLSNAEWMRRDSCQNNPAVSRNSSGHIYTMDITDIYV